MTTTLRRITIALPPAVDEAVRELAEIQGVPHSKVVVKILADATPTLRNLIKLEKQIRAGQMQEASRTLQHTFGDALAELLKDQMKAGKA